MSAVGCMCWRPPTGLISLTPLSSGQSTLSQKMPEIPMQGATAFLLLPIPAAKPSVIKLLDAGLDDRESIMLWGDLLLIQAPAQHDCPSLAQVSAMAAGILAAVLNAKSVLSADLGAWISFCMFPYPAQRPEWPSCAHKQCAHPWPQMWICSPLGRALASRASVALTWRHWLEKLLCCRSRYIPFTGEYTMSSSPSFKYLARSSCDLLCT